jgi:Na+/melibiose symporter-like transporter
MYNDRHEIRIIILIALFEMVGLKTRRNILVLSAIALMCLTAALPVSASSTVTALLLYAVGVTLAVLLALYTLATARRGKQRLWLAGVLVACCAALVAGIAARLALAGQSANAATATFALSFVPALCTLLYGLFAPDIPKPRGSM